MERLRVTYKHPDIPERPLDELTEILTASILVERLKKENARDLENVRRRRRQIAELRRKYYHEAH